MMGAALTPCTPYMLKNVVYQGQLEKNVLLCGEPC